MTERERFDAAIAAAVNSERGTKIGLLGEKILHGAIKNFVDPDPEHQEVKVGRFYADVKNDGGIFEIQTAALDRLRGKLAVFLKDSDVTVVHPIPHIKYVSWIDTETGAASAPRKSPKTGKFSDALPEIGRISDLIGTPGLRILLLLVDADEYRLLNGWDKSKKRGSVREKLVPSSLYESMLISGPSDIRALVPDSLPARFTAKDVKKVFGFRDRKAYFTLRALVAAGAARAAGKEGKAYVYERAADSDEV